MNRLYLLIATGFYSGYSPVAPGTAGSVVAIILFLILPGFRGYTLLAAVVALFFIGVLASTETEKTMGHDASIINVDEIVGMWISLLFLPSGLKWIWWIVTFVIFRGFDIVKPFPIYQSQKLPAGWGVMMDDVLAGMFTNLSIRLLIAMFRVLL
jgi:phosphatidylglycerophosphatase A